jgi:hypothetical protein
MKPTKFKNLRDKFFFRGYHALEKLQTTRYDLRYSPTFVVAPPRAGTTVTRQLVAWAIPTSYFSNLTSLSSFHIGRPLPIITAKLAQRGNKHKHLGQFNSNFGRTEGPYAPAEGELIWAYWFRNRYDPVGPDELNEEQIQGMRQAVAATENIFDRPFFNKTTVLSLRIRALVKAFPNAIFIHILRDPLDTAQSLYRARTTRYPRWLGARPHECQDMSGKSVLEQVCEQVYYIERNIAQERSLVGEERFLSVHYEDVCKKPQQELERIAAFMNAHGAPVEIIRSAPENFDFSHGRKVTQAEYKQMSLYLDRLYQRA